jgi:uncharacterized protein (DUF305 family)
MRWIDGLALRLWAGVLCAACTAGGCTSKSANNTDAGGDGAGSYSAWLDANAASIGFDAAAALAIPGDGPLPMDASYGSPIPFSPGGDLAFIDWMAPHEDTAVQMADQELQRGFAPGVRAAAQMIRDTASGNAMALKTVRLRITGSAEVPPLPPDPLGAATLMRLMQLSGPALDQRFLEEMIAHAGGGIAVAHRALVTVQTMTVQQIAQGAFNSGASTIGRLQELRAEPPAGPDGGDGTASDGPDGAK